jgi:hypothetical protein
VLPFNNIASALLLERDYFKAPPSDCLLIIPNQCESYPGNGPNDKCPSSQWYQPPIPTNFTSSDVDCTEDYYSDDCTKTYCDRLADAQVQAGTIMSIPYISKRELFLFVINGFVYLFYSFLNSFCLFESNSRWFCRSIWFSCGDCHSFPSGPGGGAYFPRLHGCFSGRSTGRSGFGLFLLRSGPLAIGGFSHRTTISWFGLRSGGLGAEHGFGFLSVGHRLDLRQCR